MIPPGTKASHTGVASFMAQKRPPPWGGGSSPHEPAGRLKLWRLDTLFFCSVIGTCLSNGDLRKLVSRVTSENVDDWSDLQVHERAVRFAGDADGGSRLLHKALEARHQLAIRRYDRAKSPEELLTLWTDSLRTGDAPGAYWAVLTHRATTREVRARAFGDVHMLSHLVGAANRADIRRLTELDAQNVALIAKVERQEQRLRDSLQERDAKIRELNDALAQSLTRLQERDASTVGPQPQLVDAMRGLLTSLEQRLAHAVSRSERAEARARTAECRVNELEAERVRTLKAQQDIEAELSALEQRATGSREDALDRSPQHDSLSGRVVLYVGGRPGPLYAIRDTVEREGGVFLHHDGGIEDRMGLITAEVHRADLVVFPVDCVSHEAVNLVKRACRQGDKRYRALRSAGVGSFITALETLRSETEDPEAPVEIAANS